LTSELNVCLSVYSKENNTRRGREDRPRPVKAPRRGRKMLRFAILIFSLPFLDSVTAWIGANHACGSHVYSKSHPAACRISPPPLGLRMSGADELKRLAFEASHQRSLASQRGVEVCTEQASLFVQDADPKESFAYLFAEQHFSFKNNLGKRMCMHAPRLYRYRLSIL
jgi:hypothetical protein